MTYEPAVYAGTPPNVERFHQTEANGLKVFLPKNARVAPDGVSIDITGKGVWRRLSIQGLLG
ncbi:hypothetical protein G7K71_17960 [Desulfofundulus sp. TPOSR]|jgi:hypothetical protein|uniref:Uncharacterized protein n=2 Tax=Peptococcaceae TaxID=186807 RepID=A0AAU8PKL8_DESK7|nr:hypothetical protein Desku_3288 [Desulfofundulus kuznetsovii DSM 6115]NHM28811.1 hypothetical protein [Desulfofundulus sp. TPOSR]